MYVIINTQLFIPVVYIIRASTSAYTLESQDHAGVYPFALERNVSTVHIQFNC